MAEISCTLPCRLICTLPCPSRAAGMRKYTGQTMPTQSWIRNAPLLSSFFICLNMKRNMATKTLPHKMATIASKGRSGMTVQKQTPPHPIPKRKFIRLRMVNNCMAPPVSSVSPSGMSVASGIDRSASWSPMPMKVSVIWMMKTKDAAMAIVQYTRNVGSSDSYQIVIVSIIRVIYSS